MTQKWKTFKERQSILHLAGEPINQLSLIVVVKVFNSRIVTNHLGLVCSIKKPLLLLPYFIATQKDITRFDWLFTPNPRSPKKVVLFPVRRNGKSRSVCTSSSNRYRTSTSLSRSFILPRARSSGFGSLSRDCPHFHTMRLVTCAHIAFAAASLKEISLATRKNSLPRFSKRTTGWSCLRKL